MENHTVEKGKIILDVDTKEIILDQIMSDGKSSYSLSKHFPVSSRNIRKFVKHHRQQDVSQVIYFQI